MRKVAKDGVNRRVEPSNKSLQLSPKRPSGNSECGLGNSIRCWADAAAQLNSMLDSSERSERRKSESAILRF